MTFVLIGFIFAVLFAVYWIISNPKATKADPFEYDEDLDGDLGIEISVTTNDHDEYDQPSRYDSLEDWKENLDLIWEGAPRTVEFTYKKYNGKSERRQPGRVGNAHQNH